MNISVSIVLYHNDPQEVKEAVDSCLSSKLIQQIYLVDNSASNLFQYVSDDHRITYIHNPKNAGFGAAHNLAISQVLGKSTYHLVLNPDIKFDQGVVEALYTYMDANQDIGLAMPKVLYRNGEIQRLCKLLPSPFQLFGRRFLGNSALAKRIDVDYELQHFDYSQTLDVPNLSGCFMFIRTSILSKVGVFDERYFLYLEDIDLVRRIGQYSRTVVYPHVSVYHGYQQGSYHTKKLMFIHIQSAVKYFNKWGWFIDRERTRLNNAVLKGLKSR